MPASAGAQITTIEYMISTAHSSGWSEGVHCQIPSMFNVELPSFLPLVCFEVESHCVDQDVLEFPEIFLSLPPQSWDAMPGSGWNICLLVFPN